ncbi:hemin-binding protein [Litorivivens sp.]|uniref:hemin-binding protein n=1 Tax=Litorivivens sp. TaxID=2020868 RepID=UPI003563CA07
MAIDLPPAVPPTLVNTSYISDYAAGASAYTGKVGSFELHVTGDHHLSSAELDKIFEVAKSADQAILLISSATNRKGHLLVNTLYARQQNVVHVHALQARVGNVSGDEGIVPFFDGLEGDADLKRSEFDKARAMANVKSERTGVDYSVSYQVSEEDPGVVGMVFEGKEKADADRTDLKFKLSNEGSRFAGRYYADAGVTHSTLGGTNLSLDYQKAFPDLGESREGDEYDQISVGVNKPFSFGLYGLRASFAEYTQDFTPESVGAGAGQTCDPLLGLLCLPVGGAATSNSVFDAEITQIAFTGEQVLSSDIDRRFSLYEELELVDSQIEDQSGANLQDEVYTTLEVGARYNRQSRLGDTHLLKYTLTASAKAGIDDDGGSLESTPDASGVAVGKRAGDFIVFKPRAAVQISNRKRTTVDVDFAAQMADDQLPQQQQWVLGGVNAISSYVPGVLVGDSGMFARLGLNHKLVDLDNFDLVAGVFGEYGEANFEDASGDAGDTAAISDIGVRIKATYAETLEVNLVIADSISEKNLPDAFLEGAEADFFASVKFVF